MKSGWAWTISARKPNPSTMTWLPWCNITSSHLVITRAWVCQFVMALNAFHCYSCMTCQSKGHKRNKEDRSLKATCPVFGSDVQLVNTPLHYSMFFFLSFTICNEFSCLCHFKMKKLHKTIHAFWIHFKIRYSLLEYIIILFKYFTYFVNYIIKGEAYTHTHTVQRLSWCSPGALKAWRS